MLLTIAQVAERLQCSPAHIHNLIRARQMAETHAPFAVPPRLRPLLDTRFPQPRYLSASRRMPRIDEKELQRWLEKQ